MTLNCLARANSPEAAIEACRKITNSHDQLKVMDTSVSPETARRYNLQPGQAVVL